MKREFLKELGLEDEAIDKIMAEHGKTTQKIGGERDSLVAERDQLKASLKERDASLETLKKSTGDAEAMKKQLEESQAAHKEKDKAHATEMTRLRTETAIKLELSGQVHDPMDIIGRLEMDKIELNESGGLKTKLDDLLNPIREAKPYLFIEKKDGPPQLDGAKPAPAGAKPPPGSDPFLDGFETNYNG